MLRTHEGLTIECLSGDITKQNDCDIIVNAANSQLAGGGGVDGAIHRAAGSKLARASRALGPIDAGEAVITPAFNLPNDSVIHCVGPVYNSNSRVADKLAACYTRALELAAEAGAHRIAFPAISCGVYGYPLDEASQKAVRAVLDRTHHRGSVDMVRFVLFSHEVLAAFETALANEL